MLLEAPEYFVPIIKPVSFACNLGCTYCSYGPPNASEFPQELQDATRGKFAVMNDEILHALFEASFAYNKHKADFIWHGGEALLAGKDFFVRMVDIQDKMIPFDMAVVNILQTNAVLIDDAWIEIFR